MQPATQTQVLFDYDKWNAQLPQLAKRYQTDKPFPHIVLENFLEPWAAEQALAAFPAVADSGWIHYLHFNERKHGLNKMELLPPFVQQVITELNSRQFLQFISALTGIPNILADDQLEGGGLHQSERNGFLNIHADFTVHPHKRHWRRRINILIYLNKDWKAEYNGALELWSRDMSACEAKIAPVFNRCVIFNTDETSYHGVPDVILCPPDQTRKSIALYYFTEEAALPPKRATDYRARPQDGARSVLIYLDKQALWGYNWLKGKLGINDDFVSKVLNLFGGKKKK